MVASLRNFMGFIWSHFFCSFYFFFSFFFHSNPISKAVVSTLTRAKEEARYSREKVIVVQIDGDSDFAVVVVIIIVYDGIDFVVPTDVDSEVDVVVIIDGDLNVDVVGPF